MVKYLSRSRFLTDRGGVGRALKCQQAVSGFNPFPTWRPWESDKIFPFKCKVFVMVFLDSFSMSSLKARQGPSPPSVEQILEDLTVAKDDDVVFKSAMLGELLSSHATRDQTKDKTSNTASYADKAGKLTLFILFDSGIALILFLE